MSTETQTRTALTAALDMAAPIVTPQALVSFGVALLDLIKAEVIQATGAEEEYLSASALAKRLGVSRWQVYEHGGDPKIRKLKPTPTSWTRYNVADFMRRLSKTTLPANNR